VRHRFRIVLRRAGLLFRNHRVHGLTGDEVSAFVGVEVGVEAGDTLPVWLAPVHDAAFRSGNAGRLKKPGGFAHG
jgi:hypothetical protein